jgi:hypothetical protein
MQPVKTLNQVVESPQDVTSCKAASIVRHSLASRSCWGMSVGSTSAALISMLSETAGAARQTSQASQDYVMHKDQMVQNSHAFHSCLLCMYPVLPSSAHSSTAHAKPFVHCWLYCWCTVTVPLASHSCHHVKINRCRSDGCTVDVLLVHCPQ